MALLIGPTVPLPALPPLGESLKYVEIFHSDSGRSGFQISFSADRSGLFGALDYPIHKSPQLKEFNRVVLTMIFNSPIPSVIIDGIITNLQLTAGSETGDYITITGEDVSVMMDMEEKIAEHPGQPELAIANKIIVTYAKYGLIPKVIPPPSVDIPLPIDRIPIQHGTDFGYLNEMAERYGYIFYIDSGPVPGVNTAYWGPPVRLGIPQPAITYNMGSDSNVENIHFENNALAPVKVEGDVQDKVLNKKLPIMTFMPKRTPLSRKPSFLTNAMNIRKVLPESVSGLKVTGALSRAQGMTDASVDSVVTAKGEIDSMKYGGILKARSIVGLRGVGDTYDGMYYVKEVKHKIGIGSYKQEFTLTRDGTGSITPFVRP